MSYAKDAVLWGTLSPTIRSDPAALKAYFVGAFQALPKAIVKFGDQLIRVYGNTAVNSGYYTFSYTKDGETKSIPARYSFTYVKDGNDWKIVDHHSSAVPPPPRWGYAGGCAAISGRKTAWPRQGGAQASTTTSSSAPARPAACWPTGSPPMRERACCCSKPAAWTTGSGSTSRSALSSPSAIRARTGCARPCRRKGSTAAASTIRAARRSAARPPSTP